MPHYSTAFHPSIHNHNRLAQVSFPTSVHLINLFQFYSRIKFKTILLCLLHFGRIRDLILRSNLHHVFNDKKKGQNQPNETSRFLHNPIKCSSRYYPKKEIKEALFYPLKLKRHIFLCFIPLIRTM